MWFNIYLMAEGRIDLGLYIASMLMGAVLLTNIGLLSEQNFKMLQGMIASGSRKGP